MTFYRSFCRLFWLRILGKETQKVTQKDNPMTESMFREGIHERHVMHTHSDTHIPNRKTPRAGSGVRVFGVITSS